MESCGKTSVAGSVLVHRAQPLLSPWERDWHQCQAASGPPGSLLWALAPFVFLPGRGWGSVGVREAAQAVGRPPGSQRPASPSHAAHAARIPQEINHLLHRPAGRGRGAAGREGPTLVVVTFPSLHAGSAWLGPAVRLQQGEALSVLSSGLWLRGTSGSSSWWVSSLRHRLSNLLMSSTIRHIHFPVRSRSCFVCDQ